MIDYVKLCTKGWKNVQDENGKEIPFNPELLEMLPGDVFDKLALAIIGKVEDFEKNLLAELNS